MPDQRKLSAPLQDVLKKARKTPGLLTYEEFCWLLEAVGWERCGPFQGNGSVWISERHKIPLTIQPTKDGKAREKQVQTFLDIYDLSI